MSRLYDEVKKNGVSNTYYKVKGKKLPWDPYKAPRFDEEAIAAIEDGKKDFDKACHRVATIYAEFQDVSWRVQHVRPTIEKVDKVEERTVVYLIENGYTAF